MQVLGKNLSVSSEPTTPCEEQWNSIHNKKEGAYGLLCTGEADFATKIQDSQLKEFSCIPLKTSIFKSYTIVCSLITSNLTGKDRHRTSRNALEVVESNLSINSCVMLIM